MSFCNPNLRKWLGKKTKEEIRATLLDTFHRGYQGKNSEQIVREKCSLMNQIACKSEVVVDRISEEEIQRYSRPHLNKVAEKDKEKTKEAEQSKDTEVLTGAVENQSEEEIFDKVSIDENRVKEKKDESLVDEREDGQQESFKKETNSSNLKDAKENLSSANKLGSLHKKPSTTRITKKQATHNRKINKSVEGQNKNDKALSKEVDNVSMEKTEHEKSTELAFNGKTTNQQHKLSILRITKSPEKCNQTSNGQMNKDQNKNVAVPMKVDSVGIKRPTNESAHGEKSSDQQKNSSAAFSFKKAKIAFKSVECQVTKEAPSMEIDTVNVERAKGEEVNESEFQGKTGGKLKTSTTNKTTAIEDTSNHESSLTANNTKMQESSNHQTNTSIERHEAVSMEIDNVAVGRVDSQEVDGSASVEITDCNKNKQSLTDQISKLPEIHDQNTNKSLSIIDKNKGQSLEVEDDDDVQIVSVTPAPQNPLDSKMQDKQRVKNNTKLQLASLKAQIEKKLKAKNIEIPYFKELQPQVSGKSTNEHQDKMSDELSDVGHKESESPQKIATPSTKIMSDPLTKNELSSEAFKRPSESSVDSVKTPTVKQTIFGHKESESPQKIATPSTKIMSDPLPKNELSTKDFKRPSESSVDSVKTPTVKQTVFGHKESESPQKIATPSTKIMSDPLPKNELSTKDFKRPSESSVDSVKTPTVKQTVFGHKESESPQKIATPSTKIMSDPLPKNELSTKAFKRPSESSIDSVKTTTVKKTKIDSGLSQVPDRKSLEHGTSTNQSFVELATTSLSSFNSSTQDPKYQSKNLKTNEPAPQSNIYKLLSIDISPIEEDLIEKSTKFLFTFATYKSCSSHIMPEPILKKVSSLFYECLGKDSSSSLLTDPMVVVKIFLSIYLKNINIMNVEKMAKCAEILHLFICDSRRLTQQLEGIQKLSSRTTQGIEEQRAKNDFAVIVKDRGLKFVSEFIPVVKQLGKYSYIIIMCFLLRIFQALVEMDKSYSIYMNDLHRRISYLFHNTDYPEKDVFDYYCQLPNEEYVKCFSFVKNSLVSLSIHNKKLPGAETILKFARQNYFSNLTPKGNPRIVILSGKPEMQINNQLSQQQNITNNISALQNARALQTPSNSGTIVQQPSYDKGSLLRQNFPPGPSYLTNSTQMHRPVNQSCAAVSTEPRQPTRLVQAANGTSNSAATRKTPNFQQLTACANAPCPNRVWILCSGCKKVLYCNQRCQTQHWRTTHIRECKPQQN